MKRLFLLTVLAASCAPTLAAGVDFSTGNNFYSANTAPDDAYTPPATPQIVVKSNGGNPFYDKTKLAPVRPYVAPPKPVENTLRPAGQDLCLCTPPARPACLNNSQTLFGTEQTYYDCRWDVQNYQDAANQYATCITACSARLQQNANSAILDATQAVSLFNCRSRYGGACPTKQWVDPTVQQAPADLSASPYYNKPQDHTNATNGSFFPHW